MAYRVTEDALDLALRSVEARGDTDIFPVPFEYAAIRYKWDELRPWLASLDMDTYAVRPLRKSLSTKRALGFRSATALDPFDHLLVTAIVIEMATSIEAHRIPPDSHRVHSYRFDPELLESEGLLYTYDWNYSTFHESSLANVEDDSWLVVTDIADFYSRLYLHPIESTLDLLPGVEDQARAFRKMLKSWNQRVSYGVPIGPGFSRLIAEATISDVDQLLKTEGLNFFRYSDDYRIVVDSRREGHRVLSLLAETLSHSHGLSLNESKTEIVRIGDFRNRWQQRGDRPTVSDLWAQLEEFAGWSIAATIYNDEAQDHELPREVLEAIDRLDLPELVEHELSVLTPPPHEPDYPIIRFALGQMIAADADCLSTLAEHAPRLYPIAPRVARYLGHVGRRGTYSPAQKARASDVISLLLNDPAAASLPFLRAWWLEAGRGATIAEELIATTFNSFTDDFTRPAALLAAASSGAQGWLRPKKRDLPTMSAWTRRSLIAALSILPRDEYDAWTGGIKNTFDTLEGAIAAWARETRPWS